MNVSRVAQTAQAEHIAFQRFRASEETPSLYLHMTASTMSYVMLPAQMRDLESVSPASTRTDATVFIYLAIRCRRVRREANTAAAVQHGSTHVPRR
jgi:hypothetical protein